MIVFAHALLENLSILHRWLERPYLSVFPAVGAGAGAALASSVLQHDDDLPFYAVALIFASAFGTLALSFWSYMIPLVITIDQAAAPNSSPAFMFWGEGLFVFPLMLLYVAIGHRVFRGKVGSTSAH